MIPEPLKKFIELFSRLPGIGPRQASRIAFWLVKQPREIQLSYGKYVDEVLNKIAICKQCFFVYERDANKDNGLCNICRDPLREQDIIAVVEKETDLITIE
ncbi:MAG: recombination protein RecR, partial [Candidatus Paceibacteria bacterium]